jgi:hypothetical protein
VADGAGLSHPFLDLVTRSVPIAIFFGLGFLILGYSAYLRRYRTDLGPGESFLGGRSFSSAVNILSPSNYNDVGRRLLRWAYIALGVQCLLGLWISFAMT